MIGQPIVEQLLAAALGDSIIFSEPVESVRETSTGVDVTAVSGRIVHSTYCVASDGARSMVRQSLGIPFTGTKPEMTWAVLDCFIDSDFPRVPEIITFELDGQSRVAWIPRERDLCRFYILLDGEITEEKSKASIKKHLAPYRVEFTKTEWFSTFEGEKFLQYRFMLSTLTPQIPASPPLLHPLLRAVLARSAAEAINMQVRQAKLTTHVS